eukprot:TRINITY_DN26131_c0_g1_i2.p1 TRINITY_DN26131_c0_g1~~TRINITY_DN26131_c0_g1_i2.p1  ORF type:complete len:315 (+),score=54.96 TRINITY_DN26131_c0_g1_i2:257-1201(+)
MKLLYEQILGLTCATVLGLAANRLVEAVVPATEALVFPGLLLLGLSRCSAVGFTLGEWLVAPAHAMPGVGLWYVYALFASQTRDMCPMPADTSTLMKVHHWVVVVACLLSLVAPQGFGLFVGGTFVLELGSLLFNLRVLYPGSRVISVLYQVVMLASNMTAMAGGVLLLGLKQIPAWMRALYFAADVGVCIGRQRHALKDAGLIGSRAKASPEAGSAQQGVAAAAEMPGRQLRRRRPMAGRLFATGVVAARLKLRPGLRPAACQEQRSRSGLAGLQHRCWPTLAVPQQGGRLRQQLGFSQLARLIPAAHQGMLL